MNCCDEFGDCRQGRDCPIRNQPIQYTQKQLDKWEQEDKEARRDEILAIACAVALALVTLLWLVAVTGIAP